MSDKKEILLEKVREFQNRTGETTDSWPGGDQNTANIIGEHRHLSEPMSAEDAKRKMTAKSRRGFLVGGLAAVIGVVGWRWMSDETKFGLYKRAFEFNEKVSRTFYSTRRLAPEFSPAIVTKPERANGYEGMPDGFDPSNWRLSVVGLPRQASALTLSIDDIKRLPRTEMVTEFKCIEGWSTIVHWAGVRISDLIASVSPGLEPGDLPQYVSMTTPDELYFVGWDIESVLHPQTILAYEMNGNVLRLEHGAPLRVASPTKYGIKQIKRIAKLEFTNERPRDFWSEPEYGYDWYSGH